MLHWYGPSPVWDGICFLRLTLSRRAPSHVASITFLSNLRWYVYISIVFIHKCCQTSYLRYGFSPLWGGTCIINSCQYYMKHSWVWFLSSMEFFYMYYTLVVYGNRHYLTFFLYLFPLEYGFSPVWVSNFILTLPFIGFYVNISLFLINRFLLYEFLYTWPCCTVA